MGKRQDWSVTACVFLFLSLASQIHCTSQTHLFLSKRGVVSSGNARHFNVLRRVLSPKEKDLIKKLPGQPSVSFRQYGGYVGVNETNGRFLYYYFVEAIKPSATTPLVIWFNGGPGCSSLGGAAFQGLGPFRLNSDGKTLFRNPYSWNNEANVLFLETPVGVGFSYSNTFDAYGDHGDKLTAEDNYMFLLNWLERFPEYKGREIYLAGQSYAGHYVPQLAQIIVHRNNQTFINLRGLLMGNPAFDVLNQLEYTDKYFVSHGLLSQETVDNRDKFCNYQNNYNLDECLPWEDKIFDQIKDVDNYNIHAPICINSTSSSKPKKCTTVMEVDPCSGNYVKAYFNRNKVQEAMHANTTKLPYAWDKCNNNFGSIWPKDDREASMIPILHELMGEGVRMMVYSGDMDAVVPFTSTIAELKKMNLTVVKEWRSWFTDGQVGGYTQVYKRNLTFATVRGAGHSVTLDHPIRALTLFTSFIRNTPLPQTP